MTTLTSTEFAAGALWAANILMSTTRDTASAAEILCRIPNLHSLAMQTAEKDLAALREFVLNELPLGTDHGFTRIAYGAEGVGNEIIELPASGDVDELVAAPGDTLLWVVYGVNADGAKHPLIASIDNPDIAAKYATELASQLA
ncbi:hypothetical protein AB7W88_03295 [Providencia vermicola]|uniref:Uncharacterized protein n=1 Tax=Providencia rettgeri TaxID=587 RepID=A0A264VRU7_PRORE|nr:hypothetical protein [Providencia rettgeri]EKW7426932.1 hypothetical protein [Proteus mirabilis]OZS73537.1 hypothetical protein CHI95_16665 [Providencia rettgeri]HCR4036506.1 hypothetical protein [Morganella morganii]HCR4053357.1 hypothetical protein [Morganella morganii]